MVRRYHRLPPLASHHSESELGFVVRRFGRKNERERAVTVRVLHEEGGGSMILGLR
jgi:hypothetical protein